MTSSAVGEKGSVHRENGTGAGTGPAPDAGAAVPTPPGVLIDRVSHEDIPEICALYRRVWEAVRAEVPPEFLKGAVPGALEFTSRMEGVTYFVARDGKRLLGAVGCAFSAGNCRLVDLAVDADVRRKGVGTALVLTAVDWARRNQAKEVWIDALARFQGAHALFRHAGFQEAGLLHRHYWNEDVKFFEKPL